MKNLMMHAFLHQQNYRVAIYKCLMRAVCKAAETPKKKFGSNYLKTDQRKLKEDGLKKI